MSRQCTLSKGRCFFCLECISGFRVVGWDLVYQLPVCGPCLERVRFLQEHVYNPAGESLYEELGYGVWASDAAHVFEARKRSAQAESGTVRA